MKLRWFLSPVVRQATEVCKHVRKMLHAQKDILSPMAVEAVTNSVNKLAEDIDEDASEVKMLEDIRLLDEVVNKFIKPYPHAHWRENIEVMLVAIVVAMGIRTFFVQPFKIPTGSMQPTLFGVTMDDLRREPGDPVPGIFGRIFQAAAYGRFYHQFIPREDGEIKEIKAVNHLFKFINYQVMTVQYNGDKGTSSVVFSFCPDAGIPPGAGLSEGLRFNKGQTLMRFKEDTGDHLFVDRLTYNFRHPKRGEVVVFKTKGTAIADQTQFYIKRLIGLPNETVSIGDDRHVRINGKRLDASTPHFENVYGFDPNTPPMANHYSGHTLYGQFENAQFEFPIRSHQFLCFGDNTMNSSDSRVWGEVPDQNVIGKALLVYWPITDRFGWGQVYSKWYKLFF